MAIEDVFNGAKTAMMLFDAYLNTVAQEIGMERALALQTKMGEQMGTLQAMMMKEQSGIKQFDAKVAWSLIRTIPDSLGVSIEVVEESPRRVVVKCGRCSIYEAAQMLGMDAKTIEAGCRAGPEKVMNAAAKELNPKLNFRVTKFRSTPDDFCQEEVVQG
jgi:hypothetical protein